MNRCYAHKQTREGRRGRWNKGRPGKEKKGVCLVCWCVSIDLPLPARGWVLEREK